MASVYTTTVECDPNLTEQEVVAHTSVEALDRAVEFFESDRAWVRLLTYDVRTGLATYELGVDSPPKTLLG